MFGQGELGRVFEKVVGLADKPYSFNEARAASNYMNKCISEFNQSLAAAGLLKEIKSDVEVIIPGKGQVGASDGSMVTIQENHEIVHFRIQHAADGSVISTHSIHFLDDFSDVSGDGLDWGDATSANTIHDALMKAVFQNLSADEKRKIIEMHLATLRAELESEITETALLPS